MDADQPLDCQGAALHRPYLQAASAHLKCHLCLELCRSTLQWHSFHSCWSGDLLELKHPTALKLGICDYLTGAISLLVYFWHHVIKALLKQYALMWEQQHAFTTWATLLVLTCCGFVLACYKETTKEGSLPLQKQGGSGEYYKMLHIGRTFPAQKEFMFGRSSILHEWLWRTVNVGAVKA